MNPLVKLWRAFTDAMKMIDPNQLVYTLQRTWRYTRNPIDLIGRLPEWVIGAIALLSFIAACGTIGDGGIVVAAIVFVLCAIVLAVIAGCIYWLYLYVISPLGATAFYLGKVVSLFAAMIGLVFGTGVAVFNYVKSVKDNINPYEYYVDNSKRKQEYALRKSYFFGPGYAQLAKTFKDAWSANFQFVSGVYARTTSTFKDRHNIVYKIFVGLAQVVFLIFSGFSVGVIGSVITIACGLIHATVMFTVMAIIYVLFSITWLVDRIYLQLHSVKTSCPYDQVRSVIPMFQCSDCGNMHTRLVPGTYGIWHRRCTCGKVLPTTFLMGRSELKAFCPQCGHELAASDVQQFSLSVVGGTSSGKTVLLSSFYHEFFKRLDYNARVDYEIPQIHADMFDNLKNWFNGEVCDATALGDTADMYSVILKSNAFDVNKQFSLYDIAGEAFDDPAMARMLPQKQMRDSNGVIIVIDPLSASTMRSTANEEGDDTKNYSDVDSAAVISNFVTYLKMVLSNTKIKAKSDKPVAVVITKSDLSSISRRVSYHKIKASMSSHPERFESFSSARDEMCREFLNDIGLYDAVKAIEASFTDVHYFPVSAMGHTANGEEYEPEHVVEPFFWLIKHTEPAIAELLGIDDTE